MSNDVIGNNIIENLKNDLNRNGSMLIGCFVKDPNLIHEINLDNIKLDPHTSFFYAIFKDMVKSQYTKFDEVSVESYMVSDPAKYKRYMNLGGYKTLEDIAQVTDVENANGYINNLAIASMILNLDYKFDVEKLYKVSRNLDANTFSNYLEYEIGLLNTGLLTRGEFKNIGVTDKDIEEMNSGLALGYDYSNVLPSINERTLGFPKGNLTVLASYVNQGKSSIGAEILWDLVEQGYKVGIIANEMSVSDYKELLLIYIIRELADDVNYNLCDVAKTITRTTLNLGGFNDNQLQVIKDAAQITRDKYGDKVKMLETFDYNIGEAIKTIRNWSKQGINVVIYDTLKADTTEETTWKNLIDSTRKLYQVAHEEKDIAVVGIMQLTMATMGRVRNLSLNMIANGKQAVEPASEVIMMRSVYDDEFAGEANQIDVLQIIRDKETGAIMKKDEHYDLIKDPTKQYRIFTLTKSRKGQTGQSYLYEFDGSINKWTEIGRCVINSD